MGRLNLIFLLALVCRLAAATSTVLRVDVEENAIAVRQEPARHWVVGDIVCIVRRATDTACGKISTISDDEGVVIIPNMERLSEKPASGDVARLAGLTLPAGPLLAKVVSINSDNDLVSISQLEGSRVWQLGDKACLLRDKKDFACGSVSNVDTEGAKLKLDDKAQITKVQLGDRARLASVSVPSSVKAFSVSNVNTDDNSVMLSADEQGPWEVNDQVCVADGKNQYWCGNVAYLSEKGALIKFEYRQQSTKLPEEGNVYLIDVTSHSAERLLAATSAAEVAEPAPASTTGSAEEEREEKSHPFGALAVGVNYVFPIVEYNQFFGARFSLDVGGIFLSHRGTETKENFDGYGWYGGMTYLFSDDSAGVFLKASGGMLSLKMADPDYPPKVSSPTITVVSGWRWALSNHLTARFAMGVQWIARPNSLLLPAILIDFGRFF